ncbi:MAG: iron ABC transporter permease [Candidatus Methanomethylophilus sp.]|nr:iron ABC transporter permease [Methanomethylophilus sp.]
MTSADSGSKNELISGYHQQIARKFILLAVIIAGIVLTVGLLSVSTYDSISLKEAYEIIWGHITGVKYELRSTYWWADRYIWNRALPRAVVAILTGMSLAACGTLMQSILANPLADPYSTGISSGACFGAVAAIIVGMTYSTAAGTAGIVSNAFIGSLVPALLIIVLAERIRMTPATMILVGTAISYFFNSLVTFMMVTTDADTLQSAYLWQVGSFDGLTWSSVPVMLVATVVGSALVIWLSSRLNLASLGDNTAISLGLDIRKFRIFSLILMSIMTAAVISYTGIIGFVGIVAPHIVRLVIGADNRFVIPISMGCGALLMLVADYLALSIANLPVGVIISLIGSPIFFILIVWQRKGTGAIY